MYMMSNSLSCTLQAGATAVVPETLEPSLQLASAVLSQLNMPQDEVAHAIQAFRRSHISELQVRPHRLRANMMLVTARLAALVAFTFAEDLTGLVQAVLVLTKQMLLCCMASLLLKRQLSVVV